MNRTRIIFFAIIGLVLVAVGAVLIWQLVEAQQTVLPGFAVGYNSIGACASVNQLHFQSFIRPEPLPIEQLRWRHNGGGDDHQVELAASQRVRAPQGLGHPYVQRLHGCG